MLKNNLRKHDFHILTAVILSLVFAAVTVFALSQKERLFMDEVLSYSRSTQPVLPADNYNIPYNATYTDPGQMFIENVLSVPKPFNFKDVYIQQRSDVHPPLYYYLLHFICSLFPGTFSIWYAGVINILFGILTLVMLGRIIRVFTDDRLTYVLSLTVYIFSHAIISQTVFLRMYIMLGFWITALTYLFIHDPLHEKDIRYYIYLFITTYCGISTHHHFLLFLASASFAYLLLLLKHRQYKIIMKHSLIITAALVCSYLSFPAMVHQIRHSDRAMEAVSNLQAPQNYPQRFQTMTHLLFANLFGPQYLPFTLLTLCGVPAFLKLSSHRSQTILILISAVIFYILITVTASFQIVRYFFPIYPLLIILVFFFICSLFRLFPRIQRVSPIIAFAIIFIGNISAYRHIPLEYLYTGYRNKLQELEQYQDTDCLYLVQNKKLQGAVFADYAELSKYKTLTLAVKEDLADAAALLRDKKELIVVTDSGYFYTSDTLSEEIGELLRQYGLPYHVTDLGMQTEFTHTYYCRQE
ncbi:MAG: hypothetical protein IJJ29_02170 [Solobacterium sp.]|nr:hypothetical protein [Solobacterium sp.]